MQQGEVFSFFLSKYSSNCVATKMCSVFYFPYVDNVCNANTKNAQKIQRFCRAVLGFQGDMGEKNQLFNQVFWHDGMQGREQIFMQKIYLFYFRQKKLPFLVKNEKIIIGTPFYFDLVTEIEVRMTLQQKQWLPSRFVFKC